MVKAQTGTTVYVCQPSDTNSNCGGSFTGLTGVTAPLSGAGTSVSPLVISTAGTWSGNAATATTAGNLTGTPALPNGTTATTQSIGDNTTKLATTAYVNAGITGSSAVTIAAGGSNQNVTLTPSGNGYTVLNGNVGIGTTSPTGKLTVLSATENLRLSYDATHYASFTENSAGDLTIGGTTGVVNATTFVGALTGTASGNLTSAAIGSTIQAYNSNLTGINQALTTTSSPSFTTVTAALSGNATTATNISTNGTANQVWGMNAGATAQGWQTASGSGASLSANQTFTGTNTFSINPIFSAMSTAGVVTNNASGQTASVLSDSVGGTRMIACADSNNSACSASLSSVSSFSVSGLSSTGIYLLTFKLVPSGVYSEYVQISGVTGSTSYYWQIHGASNTTIYANWGNTANGIYLAGNTGTPNGFVTGYMYIFGGTSSVQVDGQLGWPAETMSFYGSLISGTLSSFTFYPGGGTISGVYYVSQII